MWNHIPQWQKRMWVWVSEDYYSLLVFNVQFYEIVEVLTLVSCDKKQLKLEDEG